MISPSARGASARSRLGWTLAACGSGLLAALVLAAAVAQLALSPALPAQQPAKISVDVNMVKVLATVRDKKGKLVSNLTKDDFTLLEDGRPQTISYFAQEANLPLTLGLLVDTSGSQRSVLGDERDASYAFLDHMLGNDKDVAFLIHFEREVELLQDVTNSRDKLEAALKELGAPELNRSGADTDGSGPPPQGSRGYGGGTALYDAVYLASDQLMQKRQGRKALIVLSDGVDRGSKESLNEAIATAQRADTIVYSILFKDEDGSGGYPGMMGPRGGYGRHGGGRFPQEQRPDGKKILEQISKETGGQLYQVSKKDTVERIYGQIEEELRNQYSLGYTPDKDTGAGYHRIQLTTKNKDLVVQARDGYYSKE